MKKQILLVALICLFSGAAFAQGNAFGFQGKLNDGTNPANGRYDLEFKLFDAVTGGTQIGPTVSRPATTLINGIFSTTLDFGAVAFQNPGATFIEIAVKPFGSPNVLTILGPRQQLTVVPFASRSQNSTNADNATNAENANTAQNSQRLGGISAIDYYTAAQTDAGFIRNSTQTQPGSNFNISGNGTINGNLSVGGNMSLVGTQTVTGTSNLGAINTSGNTTQARASNGLPKAMLYVSQNGLINRCYNGITGSSTGNCGFTMSTGAPLEGIYYVNFGFNVSDRFVSVTPQQGGNISRIGAMYAFSSTSTQIVVTTFFVNVNDDFDSYTDNPFMIIVY